MVTNRKLSLTPTDTAALFLLCLLVGTASAKWAESADDWIPITSSTPGLNPVYQPYSSGSESQSQSEESESRSQESGESASVAPTESAHKLATSEEETATETPLESGDSSTRTRWSNRLIPVDVPYYAHLHKNNHAHASAPTVTTSSTPQPISFAAPAIVEITRPQYQPKQQQQQHLQVPEPVQVTGHQGPAHDSIVESPLITVHDGPMGVRGRIMAKSLLGPDNKKVKLLVAARKKHLSPGSGSGKIPGSASAPPNKMKHLLGDFGLAKSLSKLMGRSWGLPVPLNHHYIHSLSNIHHHLGSAGPIAPPPLAGGEGAGAGGIDEIVLLPEVPIKKGGGASSILRKKLGKGLIHGNPHQNPHHASILRYGMRLPIGGTLGGAERAALGMTGPNGQSIAPGSQGAPTGLPLPLGQLRRLIADNQLLGLEPNGQVRFFTRETLAQRRSSDLEKTQFFLVMPNLTSKLAETLALGSGGSIEDMSSIKAKRAIKKNKTRSKVQSLKSHLFGGLSSSKAATEVEPILEHLPAPSHVGQGLFSHPDLPMPMPR